VVESLGKKFKENTLDYYSFKKLLSRSKSKVEQKTKSLIALRWNWNTITITIVRLFLARKKWPCPMIFLEKLWKMHFKINHVKLFFKKMLKLTKKQDCPLLSHH